MALIPQRASFPFTAGQEQSAAQELIDPPALIAAHNVVFTRQGELTKRKGWRAFSEQTQAGGSLPYGDRLLVRENELVRIGEQRTINWEDPARDQCCIYTRTIGETREEATPRPWSQKGRMPRFNVARDLEVSTNIPGSRIVAFDTAFAGDALTGEVGERGVLCLLWQHDTDRVDWATIDAATHSLIAQGTLVIGASSGRLIRVVALKGSDSLWFFHAFWGEGTFSAPNGASLHHATMPAYRPYSWATDVGLMGDDLLGYDVCVSNPSAVGGVAQFERRLFITGAAVAGTIYCSMYRPGTLGSLVIANSADSVEDVLNGYVHCCCDPNGRHVAVVFSRSTASENALIQFNVSAGGAGTVSYYDRTTIDTRGLSGAKTGYQVGWTGTSVDANLATRYDNWVVSWIGNADPVFNTRIEFLRAQIGGGFGRPGAIAHAHYCTHWSRFFAYRGDPYHIVLKGVSPDAVCCEVLSWNYQVGSDGDPPPHISQKHARFAGGELSYTIGSPGYDIYFSFGRNSIVESWYEPGHFFTAIPIVSADGLENKLAVFSISATEYDKQQYSGAELNRSLTIAAGIPWLYDGDRGHELGFSHRPQSSAGEITAASVAVGPPYLAAGDYYVAMTFEAVDSQGNVSRSAPSKTGKVTIGANANLSITFASLGPTSHRNVRPVVYVSNDGGLNYYRSTQVLVNSIGETADATVNLDPTKLFTAGVATLYTDSRILSNAPLMAARSACEWQGRIWLMNDNLVWPSREVIYGEEPSFNESMQFRIPSTGTGMASLDDRLALFSRDRIYWIAGDGPTDTGEGGSFTQPQRVPSDFGCIDARSIVRCEKGILFQSRRGIELLGRAMETTLVSGGVDKLMKESGYSEVIASSLDPKNQIVRFILYSQSSGYIVACWHVLFELWTTHDVPKMGAVIPDVPFGLVHALDRNWMGINDRAGSATPVEKLAMELEPLNATVPPYVDGTTNGSDGYWYQMLVRTADVKVDGLLGFARIWRAYVKTKDQYSWTGIRIAPVYDGFVSTYRTWLTATEIASGVIDGSAAYRMYQIHLDKQQCSTIGLSITDAQQTVTPPAVANMNTAMTLLGFGLEYGQKPGTGRGSEGSKK